MESPDKTDPEVAEVLAAGQAAFEEMPLGEQVQLLRSLTKELVADARAPDELRHAKALRRRLELMLREAEPADN